MPDDIVVKTLPPLRVAELTGTSASFDPGEIGPIVRGLYDGLRRCLDAVGVAATGPAVTRYADVPGSGAVSVHAGLPVAADVQHIDGVRVVDVAGVDNAATIVHCGSMDDVLPTVQALARWLGSHGYPFTAQHARELSLACPEDRAQWVTELQVPIAPAGSGLSR
jgi:effector-binding domain-containing protein